MRCARSGTALLEVIAAVTIVSIGALTVMSVARQSILAVRQSRDAEEELTSASTFLEAVALWPREDLDRRLGERSQGRWRMYVERTSQRTYDVVLSDSARPVVFLRTTLFRPVPDSARQ